MDRAVPANARLQPTDHGRCPDSTTVARAQPYLVPISSGRAAGITVERRPCSRPDRRRSDVICTTDGQADGRFPRRASQPSGNGPRSRPAGGLDAICFVIGKRQRANRPWLMAVSSRRFRGLCGDIVAAAARRCRRRHSCHRKTSCIRTTADICKIQNVKAEKRANKVNWNIAIMQLRSAVK